MAHDKKQYAIDDKKKALKQKKEVDFQLLEINDENV